MAVCPAILFISLPGHGAAMTPLIDSSQPTNDNHISVLLNPDDLRLTRNHFVARDRSERFSHCILGRRIGNQDHRNRRSRALRSLATLTARAAVPLNDRFQRDVLLREALGDGCRGSGPVAGKQADIVAALVALHRRLAGTRELRGGAAEWCSA